MDKLHDYQGFTGRLHELRDNFSNRYSNWKEDHPESFIEMMKTKVKEQIDDNQTDYANQDYSHVYRKKSRTELIRVSAAVMGIEFSYAAETAFVSPTLLKIGVDHQHMTLVWALSPLVGFFLTPILGSLSDRCKLNMGRRRPFIILLSIGVFLGLLLVPNGEALGYALGDYDVYRQEEYNRTMLPHRTTASNSTIISNDKEKASHPWGIFFTILGTVLLDFDADACQSPSRAYLLDVTLPEDNAKGLSTFTIMAGLGGFMGYSLGGINWDDTAIGIMLGGHVRAVFTLITIIFIICVSATITSFREVPLWVLEAKGDSLKTANISPTEAETQFLNQDSNNYGTIPNKDDESIATVNGDELPQIPIESGEASVSLSDYLMSIVMMPKSMQMVCLTNLFCWMAHVCYSLYFTDFVGEAVFGGDPRSPYGSRSQNLYEEGVRFGCWGMAMYSLSCSCYSLIIEKLIKRFGAKHVYVGGLLFYCTGMTLMALTRAKASVIIFSWGAGVMYSTLFTMPYLLIAHYHTKQVFEVSATGEELIGTQIRGLGTDVAIVSSMVFMAQFILSVCMGTIVSISGTTTAVVSVASFLSFCAALTATQIMYLDL